MRALRTDACRADRRSRLWAGTLILLAATVSVRAHSATPGVQKNGFVLDGAVIPIAEIFQGGPPRDGIPSIDAPQFETIPEADAFLHGDDLVLSLERNGETRAYPTRILDFHEIVNDEIAGLRLVVTFCPLCGTGMVFKRDVGGRVLEFGVSGLLYQSDVLLYDRETESLWSQIAGKAVSGELVGQTLELVPSRMVRWEAWKKKHPTGRVLSRRTGHRLPYDRPLYAGYEESPATMFPVAQHRDELPLKSWIFGVVVNGSSKAYPASALPDRAPLADTVGGRRIELSYEPDSLAFRATDQANGREIPHTRAFWFAWQAFHPQTELYIDEEAKGP